MRDLLENCTVRRYTKSFIQILKKGFLLRLPN